MSEKIQMDALSALL